MYSRANTRQVVQKDISLMTAEERFNERKKTNPYITREHSNQLDTWDASVRINKALGYGSARAPRASTATRTTARYSNIGSKQYDDAYNDGEDKRAAYNLQAKNFAQDSNGNFNSGVYKQYKQMFPPQYNAVRQTELKQKAELARQGEAEEDEEEHERQLRNEPKWEKARQKWLDRPMTQERLQTEFMNRYSGGYTKLTKMGLLARIMNIKKKAAKAKAKPTVRKPTKPTTRKPAKPTKRPVKPTKPTARKPTIVRRK
jgi:hypothetical protein